MSIVTMRWDEMTKTEFVGWFGVTETRRTEYSWGLDIWCKPGGYQEAIDLNFELDTAGQVHKAQLLLDRHWKDAPATAPFAADITKSFLLTLAGGDPPVQLAGHAVERSMGNSPGVISRTDGSGGPPPFVDPAVGPVLDAYLGRRDRAELRGASSFLTVENFGSEDISGPKTELCCRIGWSAL